jgi:L-threonylcarbamoyladenylate synthase
MMYHLLNVETPPGFRRVEALATDGCLVTAAANLFSALHRLDAASVRKIYAVHVPEEGLGRAIMDRLRRAAHD